ARDLHTPTLACWNFGFLNMTTPKKVSNLFASAVFSLSWCTSARACALRILIRFSMQTCFVFLLICKMIRFIAWLSAHAQAYAYFYIFDVLHHASNVHESSCTVFSSARLYIFLKIKVYDGQKF